MPPVIALVKNGLSYILRKNGYTSNPTVNLNLTGLTNGTTYSKVQWKLNKKDTPSSSTSSTVFDWVDIPSTNFTASGTTQDFNEKALDFNNLKTPGVYTLTARLYDNAGTPALVAGQSSTDLDIYIGQDIGKNVALSGQVEINGAALAAINNQELTINDKIKFFIADADKSDVADPDAVFEIYRGDKLVGTKSYTDELFINVNDDVDGNIGAYTGKLRNISTGKVEDLTGSFTLIKKLEAKINISTNTRADIYPTEVSNFAATTFRAIVNNGSGNFSYDWQAGGTSLGVANSATYVRAAAAAAVAITCVVTDITSTSTSTSNTINTKDNTQTVNTPILTVDDTSGYVNQKVKFTISAAAGSSLGKKPYFKILDGSNQVVAESIFNVIEYVIPEPQQGAVITTRDYKAVIEERNDTPITISPVSAAIAISLLPNISSLTISPTKFKLGQQITITANMIGGSGNISDAKLYKDGIVTSVAGTISGKTVTFTLAGVASALGDYSVYVKDSTSGTALDNFDTLTKKVISAVLQDDLKITASKDKDPKIGDSTTFSVASSGGVGDKRTFRNEIIDGDNNILRSILGSDNKLVLKHINNKPFSFRASVTDEDGKIAEILLGPFTASSPDDNLLKLEIQNKNIQPLPGKELIVPVKVSGGNGSYKGLTLVGAIPILGGSDEVVESNRIKFEESDGHNDIFDLRFMIPDYAYAGGQKEMVVRLLQNVSSTEIKELAVAKSNKFNIEVKDSLSVDALLAALKAQTDALQKKLGNLTRLQGRLLLKK